jgi:hypothetical protein
MAKQRCANIDACAGAVEEVARIVAQIRARWPAVRIVPRAASGFAGDALMRWCEQGRVDVLFGWPRTSAWSPSLPARSRRPRRRAKPLANRHAGSRTSRGPRVTAGAASASVVAKAEWTRGAANPRFVVTSLSGADAAPQRLYEEIYCARGDMENRIKEGQLDLFADRTSAAKLRAN